MASDVEVCNIALRVLGATRIVSLSGDSKEARACNDLYAPTRRAALRGGRFNFSIKRDVLAADGTDPAWGFDNRFALPSDCLKVLNVDGLADDEWAVENGYIVSVEATAINVLYVADVENAALFDPLFVNLFAGRLAVQLVEPLTASNVKAERAERFYKDARMEAALHDAIEGTPTTQEESAWITARM